MCLLAVLVLQGRYCSKMYSRYVFFPDGGLIPVGAFPLRYRNLKPLSLPSDLGIRGCSNDSRFFSQNCHRHEFVFSFVCLCRKKKTSYGSAQSVLYKSLEQLATIKNSSGCIPTALTETCTKRS